MTDIESLRLLTEAVETAGADIAPSYAEYVQLAFAIATDCGEAGREFFHRLCRISAKYQSAHAERMFSNALTKQQGAIHLGTAFHLAESTGVKICREDRKKVMNNRTGTVGTESSPHNFSTHAHVYNKVEEEKSESEELLEGPASPITHFHLRRLAEATATHHKLWYYRHSKRRTLARSIDCPGCHHGTIREMSLCRQIPIALHAILHCSSGSLGQGSTITHPPARYAYPR